MFRQSCRGFGGRQAVGPDVDIEAAQLKFAISSGTVDFGDAGAEVGHGRIGVVGLPDLLEQELLFRIRAIEEPIHRRVLLADAEAPHRILCRLLDGQTQMKTASTDVDNVSGGRLANNDIKPDAQGDCLDRMMSTLRML